MKWYSGDIAQAVATSKSKGAIFVVYIEGKDDSSKRITELIEKGPLGQYLEKDHFVAIRLEQGSVPHHQFSEIYKEPSVPSVYFIGKNGVPVDIITGNDNLDNVSQRVEGVLLKAGISVAKSTTSAAAASASASLIDSEKSNEGDIVMGENAIGDIKEDSPSTLVTENSEGQATEEKVQRAKELIEQLRKQKEAEEQEKERQKEVERRKMGQSVQQLKKWQEDQELKQLIEQRDKEKRENQLARQRVLDQIAQDKAERQARMQPQPSPQTEPPKVPVSPPVKANSDSTRLQFKLPDGSSNTNDFANSDSLQTVVSYIKANLQIDNFKLSTTFPRREFTTNDYSQSLMDLQLTPNAVILVLPLYQGAVSTNPGGTFTALVWSLFAPIFNLFSYIKGFIFGSSDRPSTGPPQEAPAKPENARKRVTRDSTVVRRQGNVHRLSDRNDTDDESNTWNGNSTQQM